ANLAMRAANVRDVNGRPISDASGNVDLEGADGKVTKAIRRVMESHEDAVHVQDDGVKIHRCDYHAGTRKAHHQHHSAEQGHVLRAMRRDLMAIDGVDSITQSPLHKGGEEGWRAAYGGEEDEDEYQDAEGTGGDLTPENDPDLQPYLHPP